ncbi:MAG TPA: sigma-54 dependent transcriptional regulator [Burkholderiales bacterium]|nr:sigma-54 dependent transcriptional regulator [Burkholderiales bacterium]
MSSPQILIIDDEAALRQVLCAAVEQGGYSVLTAADAKEASARLTKGDIDIALCDVCMPGMSGIELMQKTRASGVDTTFIMMTAFASVDTAIQAIKAGAQDYMIKPVCTEEILHRIAQAAAVRGLRDENRVLRKAVLGNRDDRFHFSAPSMQALDRLVGKVAPTESTVLITGESGTGKGVIARSIHEQSFRAEGPFIPVNCGAIPENLIESEFFGHLKGAFTSADRSRKGLFLQADKGTLFLDEIGELPLPMQTKLLHAIEDKEIRAVGSEQARRVDVRIIAATNRNFSAMVKEGKFREDLYFRVSVFQVHVPPLRERQQDIPALLRFLLKRSRMSGHSDRPLGIDPAAEEMLLRYAWPGNVREMENVINRACILADGVTITVADLPPEVTDMNTVATHALRRNIPTMPGGTGGTGAQAQFEPQGLREQLRRIEANIVLRAIDECGGDRRVAALRLGIGLSSLYRKLEEFERDGMMGPSAMANEPTRAGRMST